MEDVAYGEEDDVADVARRTMFLWKKRWVSLGGKGLIFI